MRLECVCPAEVLTLLYTWAEQVYNNISQANSSYHTGPPDNTHHYFALYY